MKSQRSKACDISEKVRKQVLERDNYKCVICGTNNNLTLAHIVSRAKGGKGVPENLLTMCIYHHNMMDHTSKRKEMLKLAKWIIEQKTGNPFDEMEVKYKK